ncbi:hypothetical protein SYNTR_1627 [Candidatus Syntrophocurvum alkaliphilum]|uniref:DUF1657 domain-containing protein n=1 Tax=Candidatus Syntrophocurvum alkaliphilum TaxID=2293317 RepID=A0A6I6DJ87_9FIRM|nr:DUF1657 domain-containing protein [Candidatus Syntrophocurvum alkaliphilum]QGU00221.1 hypothetical protein SYNTR_1627 [Candidatus Syntrophocurvum alkaliphilum]
MTVGTQFQQAIAGLQSASSQMKIFALEVQDQQVKNEFNKYAQDLDTMLKQMKKRQNYIEEQEPQYKQ